MWLSQLRDMIEEPWQAWEQKQMVEAAAAGKESDAGTQSQQPGSSKQDGGVLPELAEQYQRMSVEEMKEGLKQR